MSSTDRWAPHYEVFSIPRVISVFKMKLWQVQTEAPGAIQAFICFDNVTDGDTCLSWHKHYVHVHFLNRVTWIDALQTEGRWRHTVANWLAASVVISRELITSCRGWIWFHYIWPCEKKMQACQDGIQPDATECRYLLRSHSTCFGCHSTHHQAY